MGGQVRIKAPEGTPPVPEEWAGRLQDDVERALRGAVGELHHEFGRLRSRYRDASFAWDKGAGREWIAARLLDRLFPD